MHTITGSISRRLNLMRYPSRMRFAPTHFAPMCFRRLPPPHMGSPSWYA